eukprot:Seg4085.3 transcript_id=Seg4085.3/GoldUCD/mRNA.D3Y31 product="Histidine N-acetyltransferase" protein_id=Seg4085.3/GoldUCD/D3Y31
MIECKYRIAVLSDQEAVTELSNGVYLDTDFTAKIFPQWVNDDRWLPFIAETTSGRIVGFTALNITDGGESVIVRSSRIAEEYRGNGIYKQMVNFSLRFAAEKLTGLKFVIRARPAHVRIPAGYDIIRSCSKIIFSCTMEPVSAVHVPRFLDASIPPFQKYPLSVKEFATLKTEDKDFRALFIGDILTIEGETFSLANRSNWEYLETRSDLYFYYTYDMKLSESEETKGVFSVLSLAPRQTNQGSPYVTLNIFGTGESMVRYHVLQSMKTVTQHIGNNFNLGLFVALENEGAITDIIQEEPELCELLWKRRLQIQKADILAHFFSE